MAIKLVGDVDLERPHVKDLLETAAKYFQTFDLLAQEPTIYLIANIPGLNPELTQTYHTARMEGGHTLFLPQFAAELKKKTRNRKRKTREDVMKVLGLKKVRGNLGGTFWE